MKPTTRDVVKQEIRRLQNTSKMAGKLTEVAHRDIEETAKKYSKEHSSVLFGILGGAAGATGGVLLSGTLGTVAVISGPIGMVAGAALAVLSWRGFSYLQLERAEERLAKSLSILKREIADLPEDTPPYIREKRWREYDRQLSYFSKVADKSLMDIIDQDIEPNKLEIENNNVIEGKLVYSDKDKSAND